MRHRTLLRTSIFIRIYDFVYGDLFLPEKKLDKAVFQVRKIAILTMFLVSLLIACTSPNGSIQPTPAGLIFTSPDGRAVGHPVWSPTGKELAFTVFDPWSGDNEINIVNLKTSEIRVLIDENGVESLSWSPDGKSIAYNQYREIWLISSDGEKRPEFLTTGQVATWSPTGEELAVFESVNESSSGQYNLKFLDFESGGERIAFVIDVGNLEIFDISWSSDNTRLAFSLPPNVLKVGLTEQQIYLFDVKTEELDQFTSIGENYLPAWSPNGKLIAYVHREKSSDPSSIIISQTDNDCTVTIPGIRDIGGLAWSPEGSELAYTQANGVYLLDLTMLFGEDFKTAGPNCP